MIAHTKKQLILFNDMFSLGETVQMTTMYPA